MTHLLAIAAGGALGSVGRFLLGQEAGRWLGAGFPWGTLAVNVVGCLAMGVLATLIGARSGWAPEVRAFLTVGLLGGFTTFSAFAYEVVALWERGEPLSALAYVGASVALAIAALALGMAATRAVLG